MKPIRQLVEEGKLPDYTAKRFAEKHGRDEQMAFIDGKGVNEIPAAIVAWDEEQTLIERTRRIPLPYRYLGQILKMSPKGRQQILVELMKTREGLEEIIARIKDVAPQEAPVSEEIATNE